MVSRKTRHPVGAHALLDEIELGIREQREDKLVRDRLDLRTV
jgi:hypothetical protein